MPSHAGAEFSSRFAGRIAILLGLGLVLSGSLLPLVPQQYRPLNFAVFGAVGLFVASRAGCFSPLWAIGLMLGGKLVADLLNHFVVHPGEVDYLPSWPVYLAFVAYPLLGWLFLRKSDSYLRIFATTAASSLPFFFLTNALAWRSQALPYTQDLAGLLQSYLMALPFHSGTMISDLAFTGLLFAVYTEAVRLNVSKAIPVEVRS